MKSFRSLPFRSIPFRESALSRRTFLRGSGAAVALPMLSAMRPAFAADRQPSIPRFVAICAGLGFHAPFLFPQAEGPIDATTPYLGRLSKHCGDLTLFSGLSHPNQNGNNGHASSMTWLTSAPRPGLAGFKNTISLDQRIAHHLGGTTRLPYLCLSNNGNGSLSWTSNGVNIPAESSPSRIFQNLFVDGSQEEVQTQVRDLQRGRSILDTIRDDAKRLERKLGSRDREKLDEYYSSIRDLETRIEQSQLWTKRSKPEVDYDKPQDIADKYDIIAKQKLTYDMMRLALQTDSTRVITLALGGMNAVPSNIPGVSTDWHNLSHHGKDETKIAELRLIEEAEFEALAGFLSDLKMIGEDDQNLLDSTAILFGSNLGNASSHDWHNLPIILAGGGYRHGQYVAHDAKDNTPFANLFVALARRMGLEIDQFGSSSNDTLRGLETA